MCTEWPSSSCYHHMLSTAWELPSERVGEEWRVEGTWGKSGGWRVRGGRVEGGGWRVRGGRVEGGGWGVEWREGTWGKSGEWRVEDT